MSNLPNLTGRDKALLARPVTETQDRGSYVRCEHQGGGSSYWRFLRPEDLVRDGDYKEWTWVVVVVDGPGIPREGYPMDEEFIPEIVRNLRTRV
jgi:hypothetical protein